LTVRLRPVETGTVNHATRAACVALWILGAAPPAFAAAPATQVHTLESCVAAALGRLAGARREASAARAEIARARVQARRSAGLPALSVGASAGRGLVAPLLGDPLAPSIVASALARPMAAGAGLRWEPLRLFEGDRGGEATARRVEAEARAERRERALEVARLFLRAALREAELNVRTRIGQERTLRARRIATWATGGKRPEADRQLAELDAAETEAARLEALEAAEVAKVELGLAVGLPPGVPVRLSPLTDVLPDASTGLGQLVDAGISADAELAALEAALGEVVARRPARGARFLPTLVLQASAGWARVTDTGAAHAEDVFGGVGAGLSLPLWGPRTRETLAEADDAAETRALRARREARREEVRALVARAFMALGAARRSNLAWQGVAEQATVATEDASRRYEAVSGTYLQWSHADARRERAILAALAALGDAQLAAFELDLRLDRVAVLRSGPGAKEN